MKAIIKLATIVLLSVAALTVTTTLLTLHFTRKQAGKVTRSALAPSVSEGVRCFCDASCLVIYKKQDLLIASSVTLKK